MKIIFFRLYTRRLLANISTYSFSLITVSLQCVVDHSSPQFLIFPIRSNVSLFSMPRTLRSPIQMDLVGYQLFSSAPLVFNISYECQIFQALFFYYMCQAFHLSVSDSKQKGPVCIFTYSVCEFSGIFLTNHICCILSSHI